MCWRCVLRVVSAIPRTVATSAPTPILSEAARTRDSPGVSWKSLHIVSSVTGRSSAAFRANSVLAKEREYSTWFTANVHRGKHKLSEEASDAYEAARSNIARFLSVPSSAVIFTKNSTEAINIVANGVGLTPDDKVMLTTAEHHSNILPWMRQSSLVWLHQNPVEEGAKILDLRNAHDSEVYQASGLAQMLGRNDFALNARRKGIDGIYDRSVGGLAIYNPKILAVVNVFGSDPDNTQGPQGPNF